MTRGRSQIFWEGIAIQIGWRMIADRWWVSYVGRSADQQRRRTYAIGIGPGMDDGDRSRAGLAVRPTAAARARRHKRNCPRRNDLAEARTMLLLPRRGAARRR